MMRKDALILGAFAAYFAAHAMLRTWAGGGLEVDEGEMLVLGRRWQWGYGPQFPLYNWLQAGSFALFGPTTLGLAALKNVVLWVSVTGLYLGLRRVHALPVALAGALSLALLPNVVWEFQRASSHSIVLLAGVCWTVWAVMGVLARGARRDWLMLGVVVGLSGLTKANYWLVPVTLAAVLALGRPPLPDLPRRSVWPGLALAGLVAVAILAWPYLWMLEHPELTMASSGKAFRSEFGLVPGVEGLAEAAVGTLAGLLPVGLAVWLLSRGRAVPAGPDWPGRLLVAAGIAGLGLSAAAILVVRATEVESRWLVPAYVLLAAGLMVQAARRATPAGLRRLWIACGVIGALTLGGMANHRLSAPGTGMIDFVPLAEAVDRMAPDVVMADYHIGGNLVLLRPDLAVLAPLAGAVPPGARRVLILTRGGAVPDPVTAFALRGLDPPPEAARRVVETVALPYLRPVEERFEIGAMLLPDVALSPAR